MPEARLDRTVYIVDDSVDYRDAMASDVRELGYAAQTFESGEALLSQWHREQQGVVVLDVVLSPEMLSGPDIGALLMKRGCAMPILYLTGLRETDSRLCESLSKRRPDARFLCKSYGRDELIAAVRDAMGLADPMRAQAERERAWRHWTLVALTPTERDIATGLLHGLLNVNIAARTGIDEGTVRAHREHINKALAMHGQDWHHAQVALRELLSRLGIDDLNTLVAIELGYRAWMLGDALKAELALLLGPGRLCASDPLVAELRLTSLYDRQRRGVIRKHFAWLRDSWAPINRDRIQTGPAWDCVRSALAFLPERAAAGEEV